MTIRYLKSKHCVLLIAILFFGTGLSTALAGGFHAPRRDFLFGNHIDTHQETKIKIKRGDPVRLNGFFYIIFTGAIDTVSGLPIARHPRGASQNEACGDDNDDDEFNRDLEDKGKDIECIVGWTMKGRPGEAKFLYHNGVNGNDHPVWMVNRVDIPQPGSYTHFHWITTTSSDPRAEMVPAACDVEMAGELDNNAENVVCPGWFLQIKAVEKFAFQHGNEVVAVRPGIDNATHLNLVTNYAKVSGITPTR